MKTIKRMTFLLIGVAAALLAAAPATAQTITGVPGSPSATTTIRGEQIPAPPPKFGGKIERNAAQSKPYWPARIAPPKGAPNVLLIITDDVGFGAPSTFGGVIPTPALDRIARTGCATPTSIRRRCARRRARRSSPAATIIRPVSA